MTSPEDLTLPGVQDLRRPDHQRDVLSLPAPEDRDRERERFIVRGPGERDCHFWTGSISDDGYGRNQAELHSTTHSTNTDLSPVDSVGHCLPCVHRTRDGAFRLPVPSYRHHLPVCDCDFADCTNPAHTQPGTNRTNRWMPNSRKISKPYGA
ncbi:hypothetical protein R3Q06_31510 [Rhodococcus erythropolis]|uniref:hypothetical protein n=1 Tax=Rhodococcus erythropolis TaxID=1833 RepID=UPI00294A3C14|nr:hypothetical protein [Rhodococcus erythropolis]MDV6278014.1 hypothetical protein [Rhodococcus erythropolis]